MQVVYCMATFMPSMESDPQFNKKQQYIGNEYVAIVYKYYGSGDCGMGMLKRQFIGNDKA